MNGFVEYYGKHNISPVSQDISDLRAHITRRKRLYGLLGISIEHLLRGGGADILEVGAGSGYNALVLLLLGGKLEIIEPNKKGREEMQALFCAHQIPKSQYQIYDCLLEDFCHNKQYDLILAEGFLPRVSPKEQRAIVSKINTLLKKEGLVVITTLDEISYFFEDLRILLGFFLCRHEASFDDKVAHCSRVFSSHLHTLGFASRPIKDWVLDTIFNPTNNQYSLSIAEALALFGEGYEVWGLNPCIVPNLSWYKDLDFSYAKEITTHFSSKHHLLLCTRLKDSLREAAKNQALVSQIKAFRHDLMLYKQDCNNQSRLDLCIEHLKTIASCCYDLDEFVGLSIDECIRLLEGQKDINSLEYFPKAWGRGQQYLALSKQKESHV